MSYRFALIRGACCAWIVVALMGAAILLSPVGATAAEADPFVISVTGIGRVEVEPDQARLLFSAKGRAQTATQAMEMQARQSDEAMRVLERFDIAERDIQTRQLTLREEWEYRSDERVFVGYVAEQSLQVTMRHLDHLGELIDALVAEAGIESIQSIQFLRSENQIAFEQALQAAYRDAEARALALAQSAGAIDLRPIRIVDQSSGTQPIPQPLEFALRSASADATAIEPGVLSIEARVAVTFSYRPGPRVFLSTDRWTYHAGEPITLRLTNRGNVPVGFNLCSSGIERLEDDRWERKTFSPICTMELRRLEPDETASFTFTDTTALQPGTYRFRTRIEPLVTDAISIVSTPFVIE